MEAVANRHLDYRPDLDGLRAVAILPVLFFHADISWFPGGFVGVDVFFVLSGYFMARVIMADLDQDDFSFGRFYLRRIRRILPALFSMILATSVVAWFLFMPKEFEYFAESVRAAALFTSNLLFESESGYFDIAAEFKPLLHTWSLSLEEQFYIVFPVALVLAHKYARKHLTGILLTVLLASFAASSWAVFHSPEKAFYFLHFRVWELLIGSAVAILPRPDYRAGLPKYLSFLGIGGILAAVFLYSRDTPFPGVYAALPCVATALVIHAGAKDGIVAAVLNSRFFVAIGRLSYSLYLWHWPVIVFFRNWLGHELTFMNSVQVVVLSFFFAYLSWRLIEQPARYGAVASSKLIMLGVSGGAMIAAVAFGFIVKDMGGIPQRLPKDVYALYAATYDKGPFLSEKCFTDTDGSGLQLGAIREGNLCAMGAVGDGKPQFFVWGDSHAAAIAPAISDAALQSGVSGKFVGRASCPPLPDTVFGPQHFVDRCKDTNKAIMDLIEREKFPFVFLVGYWPKYVHRAELPGEGIYFDASPQPELEDFSAPILASFRTTIAKLAQQGTRVVLVMDVPEMGRDVPEALARAKMTGLSLDIAPPLAYTQRRQALSRQILTLSAEESGSFLVDPMKALCDSEKCHAMADGKVLYKDGDHLSLQGAKFLAPVFQPIFSTIHGESQAVVKGGS